MASNNKSSAAANEKAWEPLMGTLYIPTRRERFALGVGPQSPRYRNLAYCYLRPFAEAANASGLHRLTRLSKRPQADPAEEPRQAVA